MATGRRVENNWGADCAPRGACQLAPGENLHGRDARATQALQPGRIRVLDQRLMAGCGQDTTLELLELQPEGKRRISAAEFINGYRPQAGEQLGS